MNIQNAKIINDSDERIISIKVLSAHKEEYTGYKLQGSEFAFIIITGHAEITTSQNKYSLGPRKNPVDDKPDILHISTPQEIKIEIKQDNTLIAIASIKSNRQYNDQFISSDKIRESIRGEANWQRLVRLGLWSDNSEGDKLLIGETVVPPGNWSAMPAHRHDSFIKENDQIKQVPYQEIYLFHFPEPTGFAICKVFKDNEIKLHEVKNQQSILIANGYHTVVNSPLSPLYHLTVMGGPHRISAASIHDDYLPLIEDDNNNPYRNQEQIK